jgi:hypothetical protein
VQARKLSVHEQEQRTKIPADALILVRVFNIESTPQVNFFVDPWELYLAKKLRLKATGSYVGRVVV